MVLWGRGKGNKQGNIFTRNIDTVVYNVGLSKLTPLSIRMSAYDDSC